jgi:hypothetical protein
MELNLKLDIPPLPAPISYKHNVLLIGSCFTEHISERLEQHKFKVLSNPNGILFNPLSVANSLEGYISGRQYEEGELFKLNELWNSWDHHTRFSHIDRQQALEAINGSQRQAAQFIRKADWILITLGSAFQYYLKEHERPVSNNHRAPSQWFDKTLVDIGLIISSLSQALEKIQAVNPTAKFLFTVSPVRHIRDGVVANNRSKARLIEAVHSLCDSIQNAHYFPAYELVIDILRDYRFYDIDFVHPNYMSTQYVWERFVDACISPADKAIMKQVKDIRIARGHRPRFPETEAHQRFRKEYIDKIIALMKVYPFLDMKEELAYFRS